MRDPRGRNRRGKRKKQILQRFADRQPEMTNSRDSKHGTGRGLSGSVG